MMRYRAVYTHTHTFLQTGRHSHITQTCSSPQSGSYFLKALILLAGKINVCGNYPNASASPRLPLKWITDYLSIENDVIQ